MTRWTLLTAAAASIAWSAAAAAAPMTFTVVHQSNGGRSSGDASVYASGDIVEGSAAAFEDEVERQGIRAAVVYFDSGGGGVVESVKLGQVIRRLGFGTSVERRAYDGAAQQRGMCASACVYAYAGGVARYLDDARGRLGVHQYAFAPDSAALRSEPDAATDIRVAQLLGSVIVSHLQQMGVDPALYVAAAVTDSTRMLWMDARQAHVYDLVNDGVLPPRADILLEDDGTPYLQISQIADRGETRVTLRCAHPGVEVSGAASGDGSVLARIRSQAVGNHIEIDGRSAHAAKGNDGMRDAGDGVEISHALGANAVPALAAASSIGFSVDDIGGSWGRCIDVAGLRERIAYYVRVCRPDAGPRK